MPAFADSPAPPQHRSSALGRPELARWRSALQEAGWTVDAVAERLGDAASRALLRNRVVPALRATRDGSALSTLTLLWTLQAPVPVEAAAGLPGYQRLRRVGTAEAALVGACDGDLTVGQILAAVAQLVGTDPQTRVPQTLPQVRTLLEEGFLEPEP